MNKHIFMHWYDIPFFAIGIFLSSIALVIIAAYMILTGMSLFFVSISKNIYKASKIFEEFVAHLLDWPIRKMSKTFKLIELHIAPSNAAEYVWFRILAGFHYLDIWNK